jgi:hypothetical protein
VQQDEQPDPDCWTQQGYQHQHHERLRNHTTITPHQTPLAKHPGTPLSLDVRPTLETPKQIPAT